MADPIKKFGEISKTITSKVDKSTPGEIENNIGYFNTEFRTLDKTNLITKFFSIETTIYKNINFGRFYVFETVKTVDNPKHVITFLNPSKKLKVFHKKKPVHLLDEVNKLFDTFNNDKSIFKKDSIVLNVPEFITDIFSQRIYKNKHENVPILYVKPFSYDSTGINVINKTKTKTRIKKGDTLKKEFGIQITIGEENWFGVVKRPGRNVGLFGGRQSR